MKKIMFLSLVIFTFITMSKSSVNAQGVKVGGFMQTWLILNQENPNTTNSDLEDATSGIRIRRGMLTFETNLDKVFSVSAVFQYADQNRNLFDFSFTAKVAPELVFTVGQFVTPLQFYESGRLAASRTAWYETSNIVNNLSSYMGHEAYRDVGIMVNGTFSDMFKYYAYYGNGYGRLTFAGNNILNRKLSDGLYGLRLEVDPIKSLSIGAQYSINSQDNVNTTSSGVVFRDRNSFSADIVTHGLGLSFLSAILSYGMGEVKDLDFEYNGLAATLMFNVTKQIQLIGRFDTYNWKPTAITTSPSSPGTESKFNNILVGANWYYIKDNDDIFKIGINYHIQNEDQNKVDNNMFLLWTQVRF